MDKTRFDEANYLRRHWDVAEAIARGELASGRRHYELFGEKEGRTTEPFQADVERILRLIYEINRLDLENLEWSEDRLAELNARIRSMNSPEFVRDSARSEIAVYEGDLDSAKSIFSKIISENRNIFPSNDHFFSTVVCLAVSMGATGLLSRLLNERFGGKEIFSIEFNESSPELAAPNVTLDGSGRCCFALSPNLRGVRNFDFFINHWIGSLPLFASYCLTNDQRSGSLIINVGDNASRPGLAYCGHKPEHALVPDNYFLSSFGYADTKARLSDRRIDWDSRLPIAFWRGATTGRRGGAMTWETLPRIQLCRIGAEHSDLIDAGISKVVQTYTKAEEEEIRASGLLRNAVIFETFQKFKYQIDIDGNTNSWPGLFQKLLTGSPVVKVDSPHGFRQWYYEKLEPWVNYVPVLSDMSDLVEKIIWLKQNDSEAKKIGENGRTLAVSMEYYGEVRNSGKVIRTALISRRADI